MSCTFFWRCEGTTLTGPNDFSAGDTTATAVSLVAIASGAAKFGSNGLDANVTSGDYYEFASASIFDVGANAIGFKLQIKATGADTEIFTVYNAGAPSDQVSLTTSGTDELQLRHRVNGGDNNTFTTTAADMAVDTWYGVVLRWDAAADLQRIEVYNDAGTLLHGVTSSTAISPQGALTIWKIGTDNGSARFWIDNIVVGNSYSDPIETWINYSTGYTQISGGGGTPLKQLLLLGVG